MQILRIFKKPFQCLIGTKHLRIKIQNEVTRILTDTLMNIFKNFIPHKTIKFDCKYPERMNSFIISFLKKRTKYTKRFYKNTTDYNKDLLNNQANECARLNIQAKKNISLK